jgi:hypothetical protein
MTTTTLTTGLPLRPGRWTLDPAHSSVGFSIRDLGVSKVRGRFWRFDVDVVIGETLEATQVSANIERRVDRHRQPRSGRRRALPEVASRVRQSRIVTGRSRPGP